MRLYIGSYDEDKVDTVIQDLRKAGIKSELKPSLDAELQAFYFIEGKLGELKDKYKDDIISKKLKDIETKFDVARSIMKDGINVRDFEEIFLDKVLPERKKYEEIKKRLKEGSNNKDRPDDKSSEDEFDEKELNNFIDYFYEELELMSDFHSMLEMNGIRYDDEDKMYGKIDENPYIKMYIDVDGGQAEELELKKEFDYIIMDCPPSLGLLTLNGLTTASEVFIPIQAEFFALEGLTKLLQTIKIVKERINPNLEITGIIITMFDKRKNICRDVVAKVEDYFKDKVFKTKIRENVRLAEAPSFGKTIRDFAHDSHGAEDYKKLTLEILKQEKKK